MMSDTLRAVLLGIIEGVTEFLPVSSTGHLLLAERFFGLGEDGFWKSFAILIQLGAILAIVALYFFKLSRVAIGALSNADDRRFIIGVLIAFLPAVIIGLIAGKYIKALLFDPWVVCFSLIVGGAILLWVDQIDLKPREHDATRYPLLMYLWIGVAQCLAMIPGV
ncbi:undecaprenyl-diphosphate phosphatase, partial [Bradyrhizobium sp.]